MSSRTDTRESRRAFLRRLTGCLLGAVGTSAVGLAFWDRHGPGPGNDSPALAALRDYRIPEQPAAVTLARGADRARTVAAALGALGGMARFVRPGDRVLIKVNAAFAAPPMLGATTHPDLVRQVITLCRQAGASHITVTDNPINDPESCFALSGIAAATSAAGARLVLPTQDQFGLYSLPGARLIRRWPVLLGPLRQADKVIGLAPVKDHQRSGASMSMKNWYGLLGGRRNVFHQQIHTIITELARMMRPTLVILDGTVSMMHNGPTGGSLDDLKATQTLIAGTDPVAVDAAGAELLGLAVNDLPYLRMAQKAGLGIVDYHEILVD